MKTQKLTRFQSEELAHKIYVALDEDPLDREETEEFLRDLLAMVESRDILGATECQLRWLADETDNLISIANHNYRRDGDGLSDISSFSNLASKLK